MNPCVRHEAGVGEGLAVWYPFEIVAESPAIRSELVRGVSDHPILEKQERPGPQIPTGRVSIDVVSSSESAVPASPVPQSPSLHPSHAFGFRTIYAVQFLSAACRTWTVIGIAVHGLFVDSCFS